MNHYALVNRVAGRLGCHPFLFTSGINLDVIVSIDLKFEICAIATKASKNTEHSLLSWHYS